MIIAFANKKLEVTPEEKQYLLELEKTFGRETFLGLFSTDSDGFITSITPPTAKSIQIIVLFFLMNLMLNQRLRKFDNNKIQELEDRIKILEQKLDIKNE